ncbi:MAG TPA: FlgD immunoglobulin-like domain containing protein [Candidatus Limnocylindria bacterium]|nr:FlgD immunoglobulin-like domain containing protein [Candidatus Limnocylindria bacterium]
MLSLGAMIVALGATAGIFAPAAAEESWAVRSGEATFHFNVELLRDLGVEFAVEGQAAKHRDDVTLEDPNWTFTIRKGTDLGFRAEHGIALPGGTTGGAIRLAGTLILRDRATGKETRLTDLEIADAPGTDAKPAGQNGTPSLLLRSAATQLVFCELEHSMFRFLKKDQELWIHYLNAKITESWAKAIGRPELAGWVIGKGEIRSGVQMLSSTPSSRPPYQPVFGGGIRDVSLGILSSIQQVGHIGTFPNGTAGLSMATTSCNLGTEDVEWHAPMQEDHPLIHMALYRLMNGRFEQVGISWMKHGFFALSNSQCTPCQNPSGGDFLGVGCSDTYGVSNNSDRTYLGPREEVNPYTSTWECTGSHFSGGVADCTRRHNSGSGHDAVQHRLVVADGDLANSGATYFYESYYLVRADENLINNWGSRACTMSWSGTQWSFSTPSAGNPLVQGPALGRWGELRTAVNVAGDDGEVLLAVQTTDLGGGTYHYEYALLNKTSDRQIRSFSLPVIGVPTISNMGFHDNDTDATNDWQVSVSHGMITWETEDYSQNPNAHALEFGYMVNFRFDADVAPTSMSATLGLFKPGTGSEVEATTLGPTNATVAVETPSGHATPRLVGVRPNPFNRSTTIAYELVSAGPVKLGIYDAAGRLVRTLVDASREAGSQVAVWDGNGDGGVRVRAGVYHARLRAGSLTTARSVILMK